MISDYQKKVFGFYRELISTNGSLRGEAGLAIRRTSAKFKESHYSVCDILDYCYKNIPKAEWS